MPTSFTTTSRLHQFTLVLGIASQHSVAEVAGEECDEALGCLPGHVRQQREVEDVVASVSVTILEKIASLVGTRDSSSSSTSSGLGGGEGE